MLRYLGLPQGEIPFCGNERTQFENENEGLICKTSDEKLYMRNMDARRADAVRYFFFSFFLARKCDHLVKGEETRGFEVVTS